MELNLPVTDPVLIFAIVSGLILLAPIVLGRWRMPGMIGLLIAGAVLGPNGLGVLARDTSFVLFGTVGLLYIMFTAALEVDMAVLKRSRTSTLVFGLLTFAVPMILGILVARLILGFNWPASLLLASTFASHTLLTYPIASRLGLVRNPAVTTAVGGTIITDTLALLVLAVIAGMTRGTAGDAFWVQLVLGLTLYAGAILFILPMVARWFFRNVAHDGVAEFVFVLAVVFAISTAAHYAGSEPIVGAFLAGLALNRLIPHNGVLMNRIQFTGEAIFIPFFLLSVGMLLDVRIFFGGFEAWLVAISMVVTVIAGKWLAAWIAGRLLGYNRDESMLIFGLSVPQAAATLAATIVGFEIGLFDEFVVNGAIMMIFVSCILAPIVVQHHGRAVAVAETIAPAEVDLLPPRRILVGCSNQAISARLAELAILLRDTRSSEPVHLLRILPDGFSGAAAETAAQDSLAGVAALLAAAEIHTESRVRSAISVGTGLLAARQETGATDLLIGWPDSGATNQLLLGSLIQQLLRDRYFSLFVARLQAAPQSTKRIVLALPTHAEHEDGFLEAILLLRHLAGQLGAPIHVLTERRASAAMQDFFRDFELSENVKFHTIDSWSKLPRGLGRGTQTDDLVVVYGVRRGGLSWSPGDDALPGKLAAALPSTSLLFFYPAEVAPSGAEGPSNLVEDLIV
ncbi:MAG: cation:proton antiporter [Hyphomonas sp.]|jgi:Kef-type K+ transport system membrane component KefB|nr:cation:proton antiporter [Hyphomonas sp.]